MLTIANKTAAALGRALGLGLKLWLTLSGQSNQFNIGLRADTYREAWRQAAIDLGAEFRELDTKLWEISLDGRRTRIANYRVEFDNPVTLSLAGRKALVHKLLAEHGIAVPDHRIFTLDDIAAAEDFFDRAGGACVVKPENGFGGKGVTTHITRRWRVRAAALVASLYARKFLIERQILGESCRLLVVDGKFAHAVRRAGLRVVGNGSDTVRALISKQIQLVPGAPNVNIDKCRDIGFCLRHQGIGLDTVLPPGKVVLARSTAVFSVASFENRTEYTEDITTTICDSLKETAEQCAQIIGSRYLGVDIITPDIALPLSQSGGAVNEVNTTPALHHHLNMNTSESRDIARKVVECLLKFERESESPTMPSPRHAAQR